MKNVKIRIRKGKIVTIRKLFKAKEQFHVGLSRLPFERKIEILMKMREIVKFKEMS